jgi:hypothetical protein
MKTGIERIADERRRQIEEEGWTADHDDQHENNELAKAAACYALPFPDFYDEYTGDERARFFPNQWAEERFKPTPNNRIRELEKAGALIAAEIDRLQRKGAK